MDFNIERGKSSRTNDSKAASLNKADHSRAVKRAAIRPNTHRSPRYDKHLVFDRQQRVKKEQSLFKTLCSPGIVTAPATIFRCDLQSSYFGYIYVSKPIHWPSKFPL